MANYRFSGVDNPTVDAIRVYAPDFTGNGYEGYTDDKHLGRIFADLVESGVYDSFGAVTEQTFSSYPGKRLTGVEGFVALANRFQVDDAYFLYYTFLNTLDMEDHHNWYYVLSLAVHYRDALTDMLPTIERLIQLEQKERTNGVEIPIEVINRFSEINSTLRREGIVLGVEDIYLCASTWTPEETIKIIVNHMSIDEAIRFVKLGFVSIDEIVEYRDLIPDSWADSLLNPDYEPDND